MKSAKVSFLLSALLFARRFCFFFRTALQTSIGKETFAVQMLEQMEEKLSENAKQLDQSLKANLQLYEE